MTDLPSLVVTGTANQILGNLIGGTTLSETALYNTAVTFVSNVPADHFVLWESRLEKVPPVVGRFAPDGTLMRNGDPVKLLMNDDGLNVSGIQWTCQIAGMEDFTFDADGDVDLSSVASVPNLAVVGIPFTEASIIALLANSSSPIREALDALYESDADGAITFAKLNAALVVTSTETIVSNNNNTTLPTSAAVVGYVATAFASFIAGAPGALDTWLEVVSAIQADQSGLAALVTTVGTKVAQTATAYRLYGTDSGGAQAFWVAADTATPFSVPYRDANGNVATGTPVSPEDTTPKSYTDTKLRILPTFRPRQAVACFTFDDIFTEDTTVILPMLNSFGIKGGFPITAGPGGGVCPGSAGHGSWADVLQLQNQDHEILAHSNDHAHLGAFGGMSDADTLAQINNRAAYEAHGIHVRGFAYPFGEHDAALRKVVRDHFDYGLGTVAGASGSESPMSTYVIRRVAIKDVTVTADLTAMVDAAIVNKEILVFIVHSGASFGEFTSAGGGYARLSAVIAYCQSVNVPILTPGQAFDLVGPILDTGDYPGLAKYAIIDCEGNPHFPPPNNTLPHASDALTRLPATFTLGQIVQQYNSSTGAPGNGPGVVWTTIVDQTNTAGGLNFQFYVRNGNNGIWVRSAITNNSAWTAWVKLDTNSIGLITSAGTTTTLTASSAKMQLVTGTLAQTIVFGTTGVIAGHPHKIINRSTLLVTVQSSNGDVLGIVPAGRQMVFDALIDTPTTSSHWAASFTPTALTDLDTTVTGSQLNADHTKLGGVATGATANSPDATLLDRANHTGTQLVSTISDFDVGSDALAVGESTMSRRVVNTVSTLSSGILRLTYFMARKTETVTQVRSRSVGAAIAPTLCRIGVYSIDESGNLTLIASTATDTALWSVANTTYTKAFSASWSKVRGTRYVVGKLYVGTTAPTTPGLNPGDGDELAVAPRLCAALGGQTNLPATITTGSLSVGTQQPYSVLLP